MFSRGWKRERDPALVPALVGALALVLGVGCRNAATQLVVRVDSDLPAGSRACVHVAIARVGEEGAASERSFELETPFSFGVTPPEGDARRRVEVTVSAMSAGPGCVEGRLDPGTVTVSRRVRTGFLSGQTLLLPVFLDSRCDGAVCEPSQTCEGGSCVAIPDVAPEELVPVRPGSELEAGVPDAGAATTSFTLGTTGSLDPIYPVGVDGDRVIVAGFASSAGLVVDGTPIDGASLARVWLAQLGPTGEADWVTTLEASTRIPMTTIERVVPFPGGYVACGDAPALGNFALGRPLACAHERCAFVMRLDAAGVVDALHVIDADPLGAPADTATVCTDLTIRGMHARVAVRTSFADGLLVDGGAVTPAAGVLRPGGGESLIELEILDVSSPPFDLTPPRVVGHDLTAPGAFPGPLHVRALPTAGVVRAGHGEIFDAAGVMGSAALPTLYAQRTFDDGTNDWHTPVIARAPEDNYPTASRVALEGMVASDVHVILLVSVAPLGGAPPQFVGFGALPVFTVARRTTYAVTLDAVSGRPLAAVPVGSTSSLSDEDGSLTRFHPLGGGGITRTARDVAIVATTGANGDVVGTETLGGIAGQHAGVLALATADGTAAVVRRFADGSDVRLTHVELLGGGHIAVAGYVENDTTGIWERVSSFLEIFPPP